MSGKSARRTRQVNRDHQRRLAARDKVAGADDILRQLLGRSLAGATLLDGAAQLLNDVLDVNEALANLGYDLDLGAGEIVWIDPNSHVDLTEDQMEAEVSGATEVWLPQPVRIEDSKRFSLSVAGHTRSGNALLTSQSLQAEIRALS